MKLVVVESPYAGNVALHTRYARAALRDCLSRGEAPLASHLLYTQPGVLLDDRPTQRTLGLMAGHAWLIFADLLAVYDDLGVSPGMRQAMALAEKNAVLVEHRSLGREFWGHVSRLEGGWTKD